jgi:diguanylate cyclase (GGDEF)-like protein
VILRFRNFQGRILFFFLGLFTLVLLAAYLTVNTAITRNAREQIRDELLVGGRVFDQLITARSERLSEAARVLSGDFAFKTAFSDGDRPTLLSAMDNHAARVRAHVMLLVSLDSTLIADTLHPKARPARFHFPGLIKTAERTGEASSMVFLDGRLYQIVVVPLLAPAPVAWICIGFTVDDNLSQNLQKLTNLSVTFVKEQQGNVPVILASTLPSDLRQSLSSALQSALWGPDKTSDMEMQGGHYVSLFRDLGGQGESSVRVILQRSLDKALQPFARLHVMLLSFFIGGLVVTLVGGVLVARTVTKPVRLLAESARSIEQGNYGSIVAIKQQDELGRLASAFNHMAGAIAQREERITYQAYHDTLTGLPNRAYLQARLDQAVASAQEHSHHLALLLMDIDRFKDINAALGHAMGDIILQQVGPLLREFSPSTAVIACMGGDEFAVLLPSGEGADGAVRSAQNIARGLETPIRIDGNPIQIEASFGIAVFPDHGKDAGALIRHADVAINMAKGSTDGFAVYSPELDQHSLRQLTLLGQLRRAIEQEELVMYYQPKVDFVSGRIAGAEALLRWKHPQHGFMPPDDFIPLLEKTGMIKPVTAWTLNTAIGQCARLIQQGIHLNIAINVSARLLQDRQLPEQVLTLITEHKVPPGRITLEVTESALMADPERTLNIITRLDETGVQLSIDDFGTGYSSLSYLQKLPVDELKIDKSFVQDMDTSINDSTIVNSIIELAHNLGMKVTAEGVESRRVWDMLKARGCDLAQGYLMSKPLPIEQFQMLIKEAPWGLRKEE